MKWKKFHSDTVPVRRTLVYALLSCSRLLCAWNNFFSTTTACEEGKEGTQAHYIHDERQKNKNKMCIFKARNRRCVWFFFVRWKCWLAQLSSKFLYIFTHVRALYVASDVGTLRFAHKQSPTMSRDNSKGQNLRQTFHNIYISGIGRMISIYILIQQIFNSRRQTIKWHRQWFYELWYEYYWREDSGQHSANCFKLIVPSI